jgi:hypothetical protein
MSKRWRNLVEEFAKFSIDVNELLHTGALHRENTVSSGRSNFGTPGSQASGLTDTPLSCSYPKEPHGSAFPCNGPGPPFEADPALFGGHGSCARNAAAAPGNSIVEAIS